MSDDLKSIGIDVEKIKKIGISKPKPENMTEKEWQQKLVEDAKICHK